VFRSVSEGFLNPYVRVQFYHRYVLWQPESQQLLFWARLDMDRGEVFAIGLDGQELQSVVSGEVIFPTNYENNLYIPYENLTKLEDKYGKIEGYMILSEIDRVILITSAYIDGFITPIYTENLRLLTATSYENITTIDARQLINLKTTTHNTSHIFLVGIALVLISIGILLRFVYYHSFRILCVLVIVIMFLACYLCGSISYLNTWSSF
jgi:hypothetical protein